MKDIDFDELDRAVGSVLGSNADVKSETATVSPATTTAFPASPVVSTAPVIPPAAEEPVAVPTPATVHTAAPQITTSLSPARKRGQFLDMVHPSADMRKSSPASSTPRKTLSPISHTVAPEEASPIEEPTVAEPAQEAPTFESAPVMPDPIDSSDVSVDTVKEAEKEADVDAPKPTSWPDPLDFSKEAEPQTPQEQPEPAELVTAVEPDAPTESTEAQTPFVADAKVEKRPLGAFAPSEEDDSSSQESAAQETTSDQPSESDISTPEFSSDVNTVESAGVPQAEDEASGLNGEPAPADDDAAEAPIAEPQPTSTQSSSISPEAQAVAATTSVGVAQSIPQQYKTLEPKKDDAAHSLFGAEEYHQPLLPDGKKKSKKGVLIVVLLLVLLVIGGALGYFAYTMGI